MLLSREQGFPLFTGWAATLRGRSLIALGKAKEGLALLREGLVAIQSIGAVSGTPELLTYLAAAHAMLEQPTVGLNCLFEAAQIIEATEERRDEANLHRVRGDLLNATGDRSAAERSYQQALAVARRQSAKLFELRTATSLARLWRNQGKRAEARDLLAPIYAWFTEGFDAPDLVEAKALIDGLG